MRRTSFMRGYTLLELIVSIGIFSLVMLAATGAYITLIDLDRHARATNDVVSNLTFAVDSMSRAVRTGTQYRCNQTGYNCFSLSAPGQSIQFLDESGRTVVYRLTSGQIEAVITPLTGASYTSKLTDPRITVQTLSFLVRGVGTPGGSPLETAPYIQPQVTFIIAGSMEAGKGKTVNFTIEGGATQRVLELP